MLVAPLFHVFKDWNEALSKLGQIVFHMGAGSIFHLPPKIFCMVETVLQRSMAAGLFFISVIPLFLNRIALFYLKINVLQKSTVPVKKLYKRIVGVAADIRPAQTR